MKTKCNIQHEIDVKENLSRELVKVMKSSETKQFHKPNKILQGKTRDNLVLASKYDVAVAEIKKWNGLRVTYVG
jgi:membrane-bound lytic murein transglycosylase D